MSSVVLEDDEALIIYCKNLSEASFDIAVFIDVIRAVNEREMNAGNSAQIFICPIPKISVYQKEYAAPTV